MRFTYSAEVEVPQELVAVMAAEQIEVQEGKHTTFVFKMPQPIPSYLFALAVANLAFQELGPRTGIYAEPETIEAAAWEFAENETRLSKLKNCSVRICGADMTCWCCRLPSHTAGWKIPVSHF